MRRLKAFSHLYHEPRDIAEWTMALPKAKSPEELLGMLDRMREMGIEPEPVNYRYVINRCIMANRLSTAKKVFEEMLESGVYPDSLEFYNNAMSMYFKLGDYPSVVRLAQSMVSNNLEFDAITLRYVIPSLCKLGEMDAALEYLRDAKTLMEGNRPEVMYNVIIHGYCNRGDVEKASIVFNLMKFEGLQPDTHTLTLLMQGYLNVGDIEGGLLIFEDMKTSMATKPSHVTYGLLIKHMLSSNREEEALAYLDEAKRSLSSSSSSNSMVRPRGSHPVVGIINSFISWYCQKAARHFHDDDDHDEVDSGGGGGGGSNSSNKKCEFYVQKAIEAFGWIAKLGKGARPDLSSLEPIIVMFSRIQRMPDALAYLQQLTQLGIQPSLRIYSDMVHGFAMVGDINSATITFERALREFPLSRNVTQEINLITDLYGNMIEAYGIANDIGKARELFDYVSTDPDKVRIRPLVGTYNAMLRACFSAGEIGEALRIFRYFYNKKAKAVSHQSWEYLPSVRPNEETYQLVVYNLLKAGQTKQAREIVSTMLQDQQQLVSMNLHTKLADQYIIKFLSTEGVLQDVGIKVTSRNGIGDNDKYFIGRERRMKQALLPHWAWRERQIEARSQQQQQQQQQQRHVEEQGE